MLTFDALHATHQTMEQVVDYRQLDYLIQVKDNAPALLATLEACLRRQAHAVQRAVSVDNGHGRLEIRELEMAPTSPVETGWAHTFTVCRVTRYREVRRRNQTVSRSVETAFYVASFPVTAHSPEQVLDFIRGHWSIENRIHHPKDRSLDEDRNRAGATGIGRVMCALRTIVAAVLGRSSEPSSTIRRRFAAKPYLAIKLLFSRSLADWERSCHPYRLP